MAIEKIGWQNFDCLCVCVSFQLCRYLPEGLGCEGAGEFEGSGRDLGSDG